jgi:MFS family permease
MRSVLRHRDYRRMWTGSGISALGSQFTQLALPLYVLDVTGSATTAGLIGTLRLLAFTLTQLPGGALADRFDRRRTLALTNAGRAVALLAVGVVALGGHQLGFSALFAVIAVEGLLTAIAGAASMAASPHLVERDEMSDALALSQAQSYTIRLVGPLLGGVLYQWHPAAPFLLDAASYLVALAFVLSVRRDLGGRSGAASPVRSTLAADIGAGVRYVFTSRYLVLLMAWAALANFATAGIAFGLVLAVAPGGGHQLGAATSVVALAGLAGALTARKTSQDVAALRRIRLATTAMVVRATMTAVAPGPWSLTAGMAGIALLSPLVSVPLNTRVYALVPDQLMGRVQSSLFLIGGSLYPFATLTAGWLTEQLSLGAAMGAFAVVLGLVLVMVVLPRFRLPEHSVARRR